MRYSPTAATATLAGHASSHLATSLRLSTRRFAARSGTFRSNGRHANMPRAAALPWAARVTLGLIVLIGQGALKPRQAHVAAWIDLVVP